MNKDFFTLLKGDLITDIQQIGFADIEDGIADMSISHQFLFIEFDSQMLKFESVDQFSKMQIDYVDEIEFEPILDEGLINAKNSISEIVLNDTLADNKVISIDLFGIEKSEKLLRLQAITFHLVDGQEIFLDPTYIFGINIGGEKLRKKWQENLIYLSKPVPEKRTVFLK